MSELKQLEIRIIQSNYEGIATAIIRDDYEPAGGMMIHRICSDDEFVSRRVESGSGSEWKVFAAEFKPY
jgi:hypothetical protein